MKRTVIITVEAYNRQAEEWTQTMRSTEVIGRDANAILDKALESAAVWEFTVAADLAGHEVETGAYIVNTQLGRDGIWTADAQGYYSRGYDTEQAAIRQVVQLTRGEA